jgi:hypothetical protein
MTPDPKQYSNKLSPYIFPIRADEDVTVENEISLRPRSYSDYKSFSSLPKPAVLCKGIAEIGKV